jgi:hypothetical protein
VLIYNDIPLYRPEFQQSSVVGTPRASVSLQWLDSAQCSGTRCRGAGKVANAQLPCCPCSSSLCFLTPLLLVAQDSLLLRLTCRLEPRSCADRLCVPVDDGCGLVDPNAVRAACADSPKHLWLHRSWYRRCHPVHRYWSATTNACQLIRSLPCTPRLPWPGFGRMLTLFYGHRLCCSARAQSGEALPLRSFCAM